MRAGEDAILVEIPRTAALKLMATVPAAKRTIDRISIERQLLQMFGSGLTPADLDEVLATAEVVRARAGQKVVEEGGTDRDIYVVRVGSDDRREGRSAENRSSSTICPRVAISARWR